MGTSKVYPCSSNNRLSKKTAKIIGCPALENHQNSWMSSLGGSRHEGCIWLLLLVLLSHLKMVHSFAKILSVTKSYILSEIVLEFGAFLTLIPKTNIFIANIVTRVG